MQVNKELLIKLNSFEEKGMKHVRSVILQIKRIVKLTKIFTYYEKNEKKEKK